MRCEGAGTNHLGHFLLANLLLPEIQKAPEGSLKRVIIVGSITGAPSVAAYIKNKALFGEKMVHRIPRVDACPTCTGDMRRCHRRH